MVKRAIAIVLGAAAGVALWFAFDAVRASDLHADPGSEGCMMDDLTTCIGYVAPTEALRAAPVTPPCKAWLGHSNSASIAVLSQCLHAARRGQDAGRVEQVRRARAIAASS